MSLKAKIEAVLYMTDKPLRAQAIAGIIGEELQAVRQTLLELIHEYEERQGGLEIADEDGYSFQVKDQYANLMDEFLPIEMSAAQLRTLSAIAIKQPISQSEIIRIRGAGAYDHIKELVQRGLVSKREDEKARSPMLSTTKAFQEYFRLTKDGKSLRQYLKRQMKKKEKQETSETAELSAEQDLELVGRTEPVGDLERAGGASLSFAPEDDSSSMNLSEQNPNSAEPEPDFTEQVPDLAEQRPFQIEQIPDFSIEAASEDAEQTANVLPGKQEAVSAFSCDGPLALPPVVETAVQKSSESLS